MQTPRPASGPVLTEVCLPNDRFGIKNHCTGKASYRGISGILTRILGTPFPRKTDPAQTDPLKTALRQGQPKSAFFEGGS